MPTHKSSAKRVITSRKNAIRNRMAKSKLNTTIAAVLSEKDKQKAENLLKTAYAVIDKTAISGVIHRNKAANQKSRLAHFVQKIGA